MEPISWTNIDTSVGNDHSTSVDHYELREQISFLTSKIADLKGDNAYLKSKIVSFDIERVKFETEIRVLRDLLRGGLSNEH